MGDWDTKSGYVVDLENEVSSLKYLVRSLELKLKLKDRFIRADRERHIAYAEYMLSVTENDFEKLEGLSWL